MTPESLKPEGRYNRPLIGNAPPAANKQARSEWMKRRQQIMKWRKANPPCPCRRCVRYRNYGRTKQEALPPIPNTPCPCLPCQHARDSKKTWEQSNPRARAGWQRDRRKRLKAKAIPRTPIPDDVPELTPEEEAELDRKALAKWNPEWGVRA